MQIDLTGQSLNAQPQLKIKALYAPHNKFWLLEAFS